MIHFLAYSQILLALFLVALVLRDAARYRCEIVSMRNFFLLGLIIFQVTGAAISLLTDFWGHFEPSQPLRAGIAYTAVLFLFTALFLLLYRHGAGSVRLANWLSLRTPQAGTFTTLALSLFMILFALLSRYVLVNIPVIGPNFLYLSYGLYALAAGLATWVWMPRLWNPAIAIPALLVILGSLAGSLHEAFGRRILLGVMLCCIWSAYFSHWRNFGFKGSLLRLSVVGIAGFLLLAAYTSVRTGADEKLGVLSYLRTMKQAQLGKGSMELFTGQNAAANSMWLIEARPELTPYDTFHSVKLVATLPIPRKFYPDKPNALGITMTKEANIRKVAKEWNVGPGIIGHFFNDNPWLSILPYTVVIAFSLRFLDELAVRSAHSIFTVVPAGAAIGQVIAMPRGELGTFYAAAVVAIVGGGTIMLFFSFLLKQVGLAQNDPAPHYAEYPHDEPAYESHPEYASDSEHAT